MKRLVALAAFAALAAGCSRQPPRLGVLPAFSLTAVSAGGAVSALRREDLSGRVWIADFIFTHCSGPCPALSLSMARLQSELPPAVGLLSFTVDPDRDGAKELGAYAARFGAVPGRWHFVTGPKAELYSLLIRGFMVPAVEDPSQPLERRVTHSTRLALVDRDGEIRGFFDGEDDASLRELERLALEL